MSRITCNWFDKYTARYTVVTDAGVTVNVTGRTDEAVAETRRIADLRPGDRLPDPVPYAPPVRVAPRANVLPVKASPHAGEAMARMASDCLPGDAP